MNHTLRRPDGTVNPNADAKVSHVINTFTVVIQSENGISSEELRKVLEDHYKNKVIVLHDRTKAITN